MINPLKVATGGYLKQTTKAVLVIAVAGYLNFGGSPSPSPYYPAAVSGGGGGGYTKPISSNYNKQDKEQQEQEQKEYHEKLLVHILEFWSKEMQ
jgi:hypothetical protein